MASGDLVQDPQPNRIASAHRTVNTGLEYEFAFPLTHDTLGNTAWEWERSYQIAVLVGPTNTFGGVTEDTWMSDQILVQIGNRSAASMYDPPLQVASDDADAEKGSHSHR
jgi:hypothetical protein